MEHLSATPAPITFLILNGLVIVAKLIGPNRLFANTEKFAASFFEIFPITDHLFR